MEAIRSSEMSVHTRFTRPHIPEDGILHSHRHENLKSYMDISLLNQTDGSLLRVLTFPEIVEHIVINVRAHYEMCLHTRAFLLLWQIRDVTEFNFSNRHINKTAFVV
jgi:hypothetical protein